MWNLAPITLISIFAEKQNPRDNIITLVYI